jgi:hypothetical protein
MRQFHPARRTSRRQTTRGKADSALQRLADESPVQHRLARLQQQARIVVQRAGDEEENTAPEPVPVILSMDGAMIGSVYFETGRIRTTHASGPADERGKHDFIDRYNIDRTLAKKAYEDAVRAGTHQGLTFTRWISYELWDSDDHPWVIAKIESPEAMEEGAAPANAMLFENFGDLNAKSGQYALTSRHPSRGAAVKEQMSPGDLQALETAINAARDGTEMEKNRAFFASLLANAPDFALRVRLPEEIAAENAERYAEQAVKVDAQLGQLAGRDTRQHVAAALQPHVRRFNETKERFQQNMELCRQAGRDAEDAGYRSEFTLRASIQARAIDAAVRARAALARIKPLETRLATHTGALVRNSGGRIRKPARIVTSPVTIPDWVRGDKAPD